MALTKPHNRTPGNRFRTSLDNRGLSRVRPVRRLTSALKKRGGRNFLGKLTVRHQGGRHKRLLRIIDWKRDKREVPGTVVGIEYDPNRSANIALVKYPDGDGRYILAPVDLTDGARVESGASAEISPGNSLPLSRIPVGVPIHNIELRPGKGGQMVKAAGASATIQSKTSTMAIVMLPSREVRMIPVECYATIGQVSNIDWKNMVWGKAGRRRHMGIRPTVRGTAQHPDSHPHGGGEGRSGEGMPPKTPWGKPARGKKTRNKSKYSTKLIIKRRK